MNVLQNVIVEVGEEDVNCDGLLKLVESVFVELPIKVDYEYLALVQFCLLLVLILSGALDDTSLAASSARARLGPETSVLVLFFVKASCGLLLALIILRLIDQAELGEREVAVCLVVV